MANDLALPAAFGQPSALAKYDPNWNVDKPEFSDGIRRGFAVVSLKGKVFRIVYQGVSRPVLRPGTNEAAGSVDVIFTRSAPGLSKVFYKDGYQEGSQEAPDCFSHDGVKPDRSVTSPQAGACAVCPHHQWGSKVTEQGKPTRACADSKRIAITPAPHADIVPDSDEALDAIANEMLGGAMLLRIPAASLADLAAYEANMLAAKYPLHAIITRLSFDINAAYPKVTYTPVRPLTEDEFQEVMKLRDGTQAKDMLGSAAGDAAFQDEPPPATPVQPANPNAAQEAAAAKAAQEAAAAKAAAEKAAQEAAAAAQARAAQEAAAQAAAAAQAPAAAPTRRTRTRGAAPAAETTAAAPAATVAPAVVQPAPVAPAPAAGGASLDDALAAILGT